MNAYFRILHIDGDVYLKLFPATDDGNKLNMDEIKSYLYRHDIYEFPQHAMKNAVSSNSDTEVKLPIDSSIEIDEEIFINISADNMVATAKFYPPSERGCLLTIDKINNAIKKAGIVIEPDYDVINEFLEKRQYTEKYVIAKGTQPIEGCDARIEYTFKTDKTLKPKLNDDGTVNFHNIDNVNNVSEGELIAKLIREIEGINGSDLSGKRVKCADVKKLRLKYGKNIVISSDGNELYSAVNGHVFMVSDIVHVSTVYEIDSDVDMSTGDVECKGDILVKGNVLTGFSVKAEGNITVEGVVEGAILQAGGNIIVKRGIQGMKRGAVSAGGDIVVKFIENAFVSAEGDIHTETIMHSKVTAIGAIKVTAKKGFVVGGIIRSAKEILCKTAGSVMETQTVLQIGTDMDSEEELKKIERKITKEQLDQENCLKAMRFYKNQFELGDYMNKEKVFIVKELAEKNKELMEQINANIVKYDSLKKYLENENFENGAVIVEGDLCIGVKIIISGVIYYVRQEMYAHKFERERADIVSHNIGRRL